MESLLLRAEAMIRQYKDYNYPRGFVESHIKVILIDEFGYGMWLRGYTSILSLINKYYDLEI